MKITTLDESTIQSIGHAFAYYDYGAEHGLIDAFPNREAVAAFICGYVRMALRGGILHATSEKHEGFIAYKLSGQKLSLRAMLPLAKGFLGSMGLAQLLRFSRVMSTGGEGLGKRLDKAKKPYIYVGLVCVPSAIRGRAICERCWIWRSLRATASACRSFWTQTRSPNAINTSTSAWSSPGRAALATTACCMA